MVNDNKSYDADKNNKEDVKYSEGAGAEKVVKGGGGGEEKGVGK